MKTVMNPTNISQYLISPLEGEIQVLPFSKVQVPEDIVLTNKNLVVIEEKSKISK